MISDTNAEYEVLLMALVIDAISRSLWGFSQIYDCQFCRNGLLMREVAIIKVMETEDETVSGIV